jgi:DNA-binding CsgD family transcriptional regulator
MSVTLRLGTSAQRELSAVQTTCASSMSAPSREAWAMELVCGFRSLLGADRVTIRLFSGNGIMHLSDEVPLADRERFDPAITPLAERHRIWDRHARLGVWDRAAIWRPCLEEYARSAYYNEFIVPGRYFDAVGIACSLDGTPPNGRVLTGEQVTGVWLHHASPTAKPFGERGQALLRLCLPAWRAGIALLRQLDAHRNTLARTLDASGVCALLIGSDRRILHETPALASILACAPERRAVIAEMTHAALGAGHRQHGRFVGRHSNGGSAAPYREVVIRGDRYRIAAGTASGVEHGVTIVTLERIGRSTPTAEEIALRLGVTPAQARIAERLAAGGTTASIAREFGLSVHTVRRHTEQLRARLNVNTTAQVAVELLRTV